MFDSILWSDNLTINMDIAMESKTLKEYLGSWRIKLWDIAYTGVFKGGDAFKKSETFKDFKGAMLVVHRLVFRYFQGHINVVCILMSVLFFMSCKCFVHL